MRYSDLRRGDVFLNSGGYPLLVLVGKDEHGWTTFSLTHGKIAVQWTEIWPSLDEELQGELLFAADIGEP